MEKQVSIEHNKLVSFIWSVADDCLRDVYVRGKYRDIILPMTVIRRFDAILEDKKEFLLSLKEQFEKQGVDDIENTIAVAFELPFFNISKYTLRELKNETNMQNLKIKFRDYLDGFSSNVKDILKKFEFYNQIDKMADNHILDAVIDKFVSSEINLSPYPVKNNNGDIIKPGLDNHSMGTLFEELIRKFNEENNEEAGEHFTPRDVVELMGELAIVPVVDKIRDATYTLYDGACGTLGMCTVASEILQEYADKNNKKVSIHMYGQEVNPETYAISKADTLIKGDGRESDNIYFGSTISNDGAIGKKFDFMLSNPPYGKTWKTDLSLIGAGSDKDGKKNVTDPRFVTNFHGEADFRMIPDVSDGQLLFLLNNISKMKDTELGSRIVEVHNGSALFTGDAGNGASNARRYMIENDLIEAIIQLPENIFYNTGITTHIWILSNRKEERRKGKIQLIDASKFKTALRKNLGKKNCELADGDKKKILDLYLAFEENEYSKLFNNEDFGYYKITVDRPLKVAVNLSGENFEEVKKIYTELGIGTETINKSKLSEYGLKDTKGAISELSNSEKMLAYLDILKQLISEDLYFDLSEFVSKFNKLAKATKMKGLSYSSFEKTGFTTLLIEKKEKATIQIDSKGNVVVDSELRDTEIVPLNYSGGIEQFMKDEVLPYHDDAFVSESDTKIGYEISFTKYFYVPKQLDKMSDIVARIKKLEEETDGVLSGILEGLYE
ncbi:type I restriction-modification system subunit M [Streptococcus suis]